MAKRRRKQDAFEVFAKNLRALKDEKGWSFRELGERANMDKGTINNILNESKKPSGDIVDRLAKALDVEVYELFMPHSAVDPDHRDLIEAYELSDDDGKRSILRHALMEQRHTAR